MQLSDDSGGWLDEACPDVGGIATQQGPRLQSATADSGDGGALISSAWVASVTRAKRPLVLLLLVLGDLGGRTGVGGKAETGSGGMAPEQKQTTNGKWAMHGSSTQINVRCLT